MKFVYTFINSFLRTLARIFCYLVIGSLLGYIVVKMGFKLPLFALDVSAASVSNVIVEASINGTDVFASGYSESGNFSNYKSLSPGVEPKIHLYVQDSALASANYLTVMTYCSTTTNYINTITPNSSDIVNAKLTGNYGTNNNLGLCSVGGYTGALFQGVFGVSKLPNNEAFDLTIWAGQTYTYNTFVQIVDVSVYNDTPETRNSFINNINSNKMIDNQNQIKNKLDELQGNINGVKGSVDDIKSSITDDSAPNTDALKNSSGWLPAGPLDSLINLPLSLLNNLTTNMNKSCQPATLPLPFLDESLTLPCVNTLYAQIDGLSVWINSVSVIAAAFILFHYLMGLYKWVDDTLTFRENNYIDNWTGV
jgi:hypothetical protein